METKFANPKFSVGQTCYYNETGDGLGIDYGSACTIKSIRPKKKWRLPSMPVYHVTFSSGETSFVSEEYIQTTLPPLAKQLNLLREMF